MINYIYTVQDKQLYITEFKAFGCLGVSYSTAQCIIYPRQPFLLCISRNPSSQGLKNTNGNINIFSNVFRNKDRGYSCLAHWA